FGHIVSEGGPIHEFAGMFVVFGIERVQLADAAAHEKEDYGLRLRLKMRADMRVGNLAVRRPNTSQRRAEEAAGGLMDQTAPRDSAAGIYARVTHLDHRIYRYSSRLNSSQA